MSVLADIYRTPGYPGGIFNNGFTKSWLTDRRNDSLPAPESGQGYAIKRIEDGDEECLANQQLRLQTRDPIELVLAKMGMKATITKDLLGKAQVLGKDAPSFAIYGVHGLFEMSPYPSPVKLISDPAEISKYHIVFIPCSGGTNKSEPVCNTPGAPWWADSAANIWSTE